MTTFFFPQKMPPPSLVGPMYFPTEDSTWRIDPIEPRQKKTALLSLKYCLFNQGSFLVVYYNPYFNWVVCHLQQITKKTNLGALVFIAQFGGHKPWDSKLILRTFLGIQWTAIKSISTLAKTKHGERGTCGIFVFPPVDGSEIPRPTTWDV